jgi:hypothetical protein
MSTLKADCYEHLKLCDVLDYTNYYEFKTKGKIGFRGSRNVIVGQKDGLTDMPKLIGRVFKMFGCKIT